MSLKLNIKLGPRSQTDKMANTDVHYVFNYNFFSYFIYLLVLFQYLAIMTLKSHVNIRQLQHISSQLDSQL